VIRASLKSFLLLEGRPDHGESVAGCSPIIQDLLRCAIPHSGIGTRTITDPLRFDKDEETQIRADER
jgi:hypothetical protein